MLEVHYGVVHQNGAWTLIGDSLRFGSYKTKTAAERAVRRLAKQSAGLPVQIHLQDETGELRSPEPLD
jgi:hypothetical protein